MDSEAVIVARLRENIPSPVEPEQKPEAPPQPGQPSDFSGEFQLNDVTQYKFHEYFGERYQTSDEESKQRALYVYKTVAEQVGTTDYGYVVAQTRTLEQMLGISNSDNRLYRLYQWLKLDNARRKIDAEMSAVTG